MTWVLAERHPGMEKILDASNELLWSHLPLTSLPSWKDTMRQILIISWVLMKHRQLSNGVPQRWTHCPFLFWCRGQRLWCQSLGLLSSLLSVSNRWSNPKSASLYLDWLISQVLAFPCLLSVSKLDSVWKISFKKKKKSEINLPTSDSSWILYSSEFLK